MRPIALHSRVNTMIINNEEIYYEGGPAKGDLLINLLAGITIIGLPFTIAAVVRAFWLRFSITSKRISVTGGWLGRNKTQVIYSQVKELRAVPRGFGSWGDMVLVLKDDSRLEIRSIPNFRDTEKYILKQIDAKKSQNEFQDVKGFAA